MARPEKKRPTDGELEILSVLWERGPSTVREVFRMLNEARETGYTTVLKLMQIMTEKGLVTRDTAVRPQVYRAVRTRRQMQKQLLGDLLDKAFAGSPGSLVMQALSTRKASPQELQQIRELLDHLEGDVQ
ncbi:MAG: BlaI/MecI/CopY family transcriptional regulator [Phycisphaerales bacterium]|nr:MAG: BlaI/MecI/CopY family transcriptional regulator [Phycisphaerales bacterium]